MTEQKLSTRSSRNLESRVHDSREGEVDRAPTTFSTGSYFNLPKDLLENHPDKSFHWVAYQRAGEDLDIEYSKAVDRRMMEPVPRSIHPMFARKRVASPFKRHGREDDESDGLVTYGGQVLMNRDEEINKKENAFYDEERRRSEQVRKMHIDHEMGGQNVFEDHRHYGGM